MCKESNDSGIVSLSGFSFQIKVFIFYLIQVKENRQIEFETLEDVIENKDSVKEDFFDTKSEFFNTIYNNDRGCKAIQVKRTNLSKTVLTKVLCNWLLLEVSEKNIEEYILFTDDKYQNKDTLFDIDACTLYKEISKSNQKANALKSKVKNQFEDFECFIKTFNNIKNKYQFISLKNIDNEISKKLEVIFRKNALTNIKYNLRVKALVDLINAEVMESIFSKKPYICNQQKFMQHVESICLQINQENFEPQSFSIFKKNSFINLSDKRINSSREYVQLTHCKTDNKFIERHLLFKQYYEFYRDRLLLDNCEDKTNDMESRTYDNFCDVLDSLDSSDDTALNRLNKIKSKSNSYCNNDDIKAGTCIYLTKKNIKKDKQISWKDEDE